MPQRRSPAPPPTPSQLREIALHYLARYAASAADVRRMLQRRMLRTHNDTQESRQQIAALVEKLVAENIIQDRALAEGLIRRETARGRSSSQIASRLRARGIGPELIEEVLAGAVLDPLALACRHVQRRRLGHDPARRQQDLASLARAGFSRAVAEAALAQARPMEE